MKLTHLFENEVPNITDPHEAYEYADKQGKRIPELEPVIMKDPSWIYWYARDVIKDRWLEAESIIMKNPRWANWYLRSFPEARTPSKDVPLVIGDYAIIDVPNAITDEQIVKLLKLINLNVTNFDLQKIKYSRIYHEPQIKQDLTDNQLTPITTKQLVDDEEKRIAFLKNIGIGCFNTDFE